MKRFAASVAASKPAEPRLPLVHTCDMFSFRNIVERSRIEANPSPEFRETLACYSYGRPLLGISRKHKTIFNVATLPVSIVLRPDCLSNPKRIIPFDAAAFSGTMHPKMQVEDFLLEPLPDMPARLVNLFYGSNSRYYSGHPRAIEFSVLDFEISQYYYTLIGSGRAFDDRCSTIQVQSAEPMEITPGKAIFVVLPAELLDDEKVTCSIKEWNADIGTYQSHHGTSMEFMGLIYSRIGDFLQDKGFLSEGPRAVTETLYDTRTHVTPIQEERIAVVSYEAWTNLIKRLSANPQLLFEMPPRKFEELIAELLERDGLEVHLTPESRDGGRDVLAFHHTPIGKLLYLVECKRYEPRRPVGIMIVQRLYGVLAQERATAGLVVTTSHFSKEALKFADTVRHQMQLRDYETLRKWLARCGSA